MSLQGEPIVILGMFRSGASCIATALAKLGVYLGDENDFDPADENNLGGYWTIREFQALNLQGYALFGMSFYQVNRMPAKWREIPSAPQFVEAARTLLNKKFDGKAKWGWKEPAVTGLMPLFKEVLAEEKTPGRYAICVRHPLSVAASQISRTAKFGLGKNDDGLKDMEPPMGENTVGLWLHYTLSALKGTQGAPRLVVSYESFLQDPKSTIGNVAKYLLTWEPTDSETQNAIASVRPEWNHHKYTLQDLDEWPSIVRRTYELSLRAQDDPEGFNGGKFDGEIDALWEESGQMALMIQSIALPAGQMIFSWREGNQPGHHALKYSPTGTWQTLRCEVPAPSGAVVQIDPYQTPCQIWIRKAVWIVDGEEKAAPLNPGPNGVMENLGLLRLTIFGPGPLLTRTPAKPGKAEFEIEFMVQSNPSVLTNVVGMLRARLEQARRAP
jgi:hypothetical protein